MCALPRPGAKEAIVQAQSYNGQSTWPWSMTCGYTLTWQLCYTVLKQLRLLQPIVSSTLCPWYVNAKTKTNQQERGREVLNAWSKTLVEGMETILPFSHSEYEGMNLNNEWERAEKQCTPLAVSTSGTRSWVLRRIIPWTEQNFLERQCQQGLPRKRIRLARSILWCQKVRIWSQHDGVRSKWSQLEGFSNDQIWD